MHALEEKTAAHCSITCLEESQGLGSRVRCCLWGRTEWDTTGSDLAVAVVAALRHKSNFPFFKKKKKVAIELYLPKMLFMRLHN